MIIPKNSLLLFLLFLLIKFTKQNSIYNEITKNDITIKEIKNFISTRYFTLFNKTLYSKNDVFLIYEFVNFDIFSLEDENYDFKKNLDRRNVSKSENSIFSDDKNKKTFKKRNSNIIIKKSDYEKEEIKQKKITGKNIQNFLKEKFQREESVIIEKRPKEFIFENKKNFEEEIKEGILFAIKNSSGEDFIFSLIKIQKEIHRKNFFKMIKRKLTNKKIKLFYKKIFVKLIIFSELEKNNYFNFEKKEKKEIIYTIDLFLENMEKLFYKFRDYYFFRINSNIYFNKIIKKSISQIQISINKIDITKNLINKIKFFFQILEFEKPQNLFNINLKDIYTFTLAKKMSLEKNMEKIREIDFWLLYIINLIINKFSKKNRISENFFLINKFYEYNNERDFSGKIYNFLLKFSENIDYENHINFYEQKISQKIFFYLFETDLVLFFKNNDYSKISECFKKKIIFDFNKNMIFLDNDFFENRLYIIKFFEMEFDVFENYDFFKFFYLIFLNFRYFLTDLKKNKKIEISILFDIFLNRILNFYDENSESYILLLIIKLMNLDIDLKFHNYSFNFPEISNKNIFLLKKKIISFKAKSILKLLKKIYKIKFRIVETENNFLNHSFDFLKNLSINYFLMNQNKIALQNFYNLKNLNSRSKFENLKKKDFFQMDIFKFKPFQNKIRFKQNNTSLFFVKNTGFNDNLNENLNDKVNQYFDNMTHNGNSSLII